MLTLKATLTKEKSLQVKKSTSITVQAYVNKILNTKSGVVKSMQIKINLG